MTEEQSGPDLSFDFPRHSSYVPSQEELVRPSLSQPVRLSRSQSVRLPRSQPVRPSSSQPVRRSTSQRYLPYFPLINPSPKSEILIAKYGHQIPLVFHPYISKIKDVKPDDHCGFRSVAVALGYNQSKYLSIRKQLLMELRTNETVWRRVFDPDNIGNYEELYHRIEFVGVGSAGEKIGCQSRRRDFLLRNTGVLFFIHSTIVVVIQFSLYWAARKMLRNLI